MREVPVVAVVDDDNMLRTIVEAKLKARGYRVLPIADGQQAVSIIDRERPDIIVLDSMLPGIDGTEILGQLKIHKELQHTPVVMLTARKQQSDIVAALKAGAADYLVKPFIPEELVMRIQRLLPQKAA